MKNRGPTAPWLLLMASSFVASCGSNDGSSDASPTGGDGGTVASGGSFTGGTGAPTGGNDAVGGAGGTGGEGRAGSAGAAPRTGGTAGVVGAAGGGGRAGEAAGGSGHAGAGGVDATGGLPSSGGVAPGSAGAMTDGGVGGESAAAGGTGGQGTGGAVPATAGASGAPAARAGAGGIAGFTAGTSGASTSSAGDGGAFHAGGAAGSTASGGGAGGAPWCPELAPPTSSTALPPPSLYWSFDAPDIAGSTIADVSGQGHDGEILGGVTTGIAGRVGEAVSLAPSTLGISTPAADLKTSPLSMCAWIRVDATPAGKQMVFNLGNGAASWTGMGFQLEPTREVTFFVEGPGTNNDEELVRTCAAAGRWVHYCTVFDGTQLVLYRDGTYANAEPADFAAISFGSRPLVLGYHTYFRNRSFEGDVDEFAVWARALTADETAAVFLRGASGTRLDG